MVSSQASAFDRLQKAFASFPHYGGVTPPPLVQGPVQSGGYQARPWTPTPRAMEAGNSSFTRRMPKDAHSIREMQLGLGFTGKAVDGIAGDQTKTAYIARMYARTNAAKQGFMDDADAAAGPNQSFDPTSVETRAAAIGKPFLPPIQAAAVNNAQAAGAPPLTPPGAFSRIGSGVKNMANKVGNGVKANPLGALNGALGIAGALEFATAKAPKMPGKPDTYAPMIRPAQGLNVTSLEAGRRSIQSAQRAAGMAATVDSGTTAYTRLAAQQQAGEQQAGLSIKDNEAFQQDQKRVDDQSNAAYDADYKTQRSYVEKKYDLEQRQYEARRQQGAAMTQSALTYFTQDRASRLNNQARLEESRAYASYGATPPALRRKGAAGTQPDNDPVVHRQGGTLSVSSRTRFGTRDTAAKAFSDSMQRITSDAMKAFHASLRDASGKRAKGISGR